MQPGSANGNDNNFIKFKVMIINTAELKKVLEDKDFDGITLQLSQAISSSGGDNHKFQFIAYKHFSSKKKQEQITDPKFFADDGNEIYKDVEITGEGFISHFGNLKLVRADIKEDIDVTKFPFLVLSPDHGTGEYKNYVIFNAFYTDDLNDAQPQPQAQSLSRGATNTPSKGGKVINPSPPA